MREGSSDDFQAAPSCAEKGGSNNAKYKWDHATEDRLCDLYEQYLEVSHLLSDILQVMDCISVPILAEQKKLNILRKQCSDYLFVFAPL
jgi:hypothetical protein